MVSSTIRLAVIPLLFFLGQPQRCHCKDKVSNATKTCKAEDNLARCTTTATSSGGGGDTNNNANDPAATSVNSENSSGSSHQDHHHGTCGLYIAPSTIQHETAGLGLFAGTNIPEGAFVGDEELFITIEDKFKTLPYRGQQRFLSWLGYVWPSQKDSFWHTTRESFPLLHPSHYLIDEGLNAAQGLPFYDANSLQRVDAFVPGIASMVNSNQEQVNIDREPLSHKTDKITKKKMPYTPHHGVQFTATKDIPAGAELFLDYGDIWHTRYYTKYNDGYQPFEETPQEYMTPDKNITVPTEKQKRSKWGQMENTLKNSLIQKFRKDLLQEARQLTDDRNGIPTTAETKVSINGTHKHQEVIAKATAVTKAIARDDSANSTTLVETKVTVTTSTTTVTPLVVEDESSDDDYNAEEVRQGKPKFDLGTEVFEEIDGVWYFGNITDYDEDEDVYEVTYDEDDEPTYYNGETQYRKVADIIEYAVERRIELLEEQIENERNQLLEERAKYQEELEKQGSAEQLSSTSSNMDWLKEHGVCVDNLRTDNSTIPAAGRGVFAKYFISKGALVAPAPLAVLKRDDLVIYKFDETTTIMREALHRDKVVGQELLLNYCYGHPDSPILLLPYAPGVNFINHNSTDPNVAIQWPDSRSIFRDANEWLDLHPLDLLDQSGKLMMEFVALRDIEPGEEITLNYGQDWENAWQSFMQSKKEAGFRHEIGVPPSFFPSKWNEKAVYEFADHEGPLKAGEIDELRWAHNGERIAEGLIRVGLPKGFSAKMKEYAEERSITGLYDRLITDTYLENDHWHVIESVDDEHWFAHRYMNTIWKFNMHYVAPWDETARQSVLRSLGKAGFDTALDGIGNYFGYDNMTCFHFSFMGLSEADNSFTHADVYATGKKGFNLIFPIITVDGTKPELDIISENANIEMSVNYQEDVAYLLADWGYHKTSANDNKGGQLRLVVSLYCGQLDETNAEMFAHIYDGEDPAPFMSQFDLPIKEYHWGNGHKLPE